MRAQFRIPLLLRIVVGALILTACFEEPTAPCSLDANAKCPDEQQATGRPGRIVLVPSVDTLNAIGDSLRLSTQYYDADGNLVDGPSLVWQSLNPRIATVSPAGEVISKATGLALITAACAGCADRPDTAALYVRQVVASVSLKPEAAMLALGYAGRLSPVVADSNGVAVEETNIGWITSDPTVAIVENGLVESVSPGTAMISGEAGNHSGTSWITVLSVSPNIASISISPSDTTLFIGETARLTATALDANNVAILGLPFDWQSSDTAAAIVSDGTVRAMSLGTATISASATGLTGAATVRVIARPVGSVAAFPGAEGYGALALNGCNRANLEILPVTNLSDAGPGSLRTAIAQSDPDRLSVIVFRSGGTINLGSTLEVDRACLYIAGQTAPGDGIQLNSKPATAMRFTRDGRPRDIVVRYLRFRSGKGTPGQQDVVSIESGKDIVLDHISAQWGNDEVVSIHTVNYADNGVEASDISLQRSIIAEALRDHSTGSLIAFQSGVQPPVSRISIHHNLYAHNAHRNPRIGGALDVEVINNVVYNWKNRVGSVRTEASVDYLYNYFKAGPWNTTGNRIIEHDPDRLSSLYLRGNIAVPIQPNPDANQRNLVTYDKTMGFAELPPEVFRSYRENEPLIPVSSHSASEAFSLVTSDVGANARLDCDGRWITAADRVDQQVIRDVLDGTGPSTDSQNDHEDDYGGLPVLATGTPCADADGDGMPDAFESRYGLDPAQASDAALDLDGDGYTNLEEYLNGTRPR